MSSITDGLPVYPTLLGQVPTSPSIAKPDLFRVYQRFLNIPTVARWLLTRDSGTDFLSVRLEDSVLINISSALNPVVLPANSASAPVGNVHDLLFLDQVVDGGDIALGHVRSYSFFSVPIVVTNPIYRFGENQARNHIHSHISLNEYLKTGGTR